MTATFFELDQPFSVEGGNVDSLVTLKASDVCDVFAKIAQQKDAMDPLDTLVEIQQTMPNVRSISSTAVMATSNATSILLLTGSVIPLTVYGTYEATRFVKNGLKQFDHRQKTWVESAVPLEEQGAKLGEALGGMSCILWKDKSTNSFVVEVGEADVEESDAIIDRLKFLEQSLKSKNMLSMLGGFIIPKSNAGSVKEFAVCTTSDAIYEQLKGRKVHLADKKDDKVYVKSVYGNVVASETDSTKPLIELLRTIDPYHPVVRQFEISGSIATPHIRQLAKQCLEERLSEVIAQRDTSTGGVTGKKERTHAFVSDYIIMVYDSEGRPTVISPSTLVFDEQKASGGASKDTVLASLEYQIFKNSVMPDEVVTAETTVEKLKTQSQLKVKLKYNDLVTVNETVDGEDIQQQKLGIREKAKNSKKYRKILGALACLGIAVHSASISEQRTTGSSFTPVHSYEVEASDKLIGIFDELDNYFDFLETKPQTTSDIIGELLREAHNIPATNGINSSIQEEKNKALWYISSAPGVDVSGYWGVNRYDSLVRDSQGDFVWQTQDIVERMKLYYGDDFMNGTVDLHPIEEVAAGSRIGKDINVQASIVFDSTNIFIDIDGNKWQAIDVPVLNNHVVVAGELSIMVTPNYGSEPMQNIGIMPTRVWQNDGGGTTIFMQIPNNFILPSLENPDGYIEMTYTISPNNRPTFINDLEGGVVFAPDSGQSEIFRNRDQYAEIFTDSTAYDLTPTEGEDTNGDEAYNLIDLANETMRNDTANCFTANSLAVALSNNELAPVSGFLLTPSNVMHDLEQTDGLYSVLAVRDSHLYTVDTAGNIEDATPTTGASAEDIQALKHPKLTPENNNSTPFIVTNAEKSQKLRADKKAKEAEAQSHDRDFLFKMLAVGLATSVITIGGLSLKTRLRKYYDKVHFTANSKNLRAGALAMLAIYKLDGNNGHARINKDEINNVTTLPKKSDIAVKKPKVIKKILKAHRNKAEKPSVYELSDIYRASRMVSLSRREED